MWMLERQFNDWVSKIINLTKQRTKHLCFDSFEGLSDFSTEDKTKKVTLKEEEKLKTL